MVLPSTRRPTSAGRLQATSSRPRSTESYRIAIDGNGERVLAKHVLHRLEVPLDVTTQGDDEAFPGTIWIADYVTGRVTVLEPADFERARRWRSLARAGTERQETAFVRVGPRLYLAGGAKRLHEAYDFRPAPGPASRRSCTRSTMSRASPSIE
jgi:hypothetical protein